MLNDHLAPFVSLTIAKGNAVAAADRIDRCLDDIQALCLSEDPVATRDFEPAELYVTANIRMRAMTYRRDVKPAWAGAADITDVQNHLVLIAARKDMIAIHATDPRLKPAFHAALIGETAADAPLSWLSPIPRAVMAAAFLQDGQAKTLWLRGVHRRSATRADAKILGGSDLDLSLDPFEDQSFYWSAARSKSKALAVTVGVSPKASRIWVGKASTLKQFGLQVADLIDAVGAAKAGAGEPFRFLAVPLDKVDPAEVTGGYDISMLPPDLDEAGDADQDKMQAAAALILSADLVGEPADGANMTVQVERNDVLLGSFTLKVAVANDGKVKFKAEDVVASGVDDDSFQGLVKLAERGTALNIRYDSGHSVSGKQVYQLRASRIGFEHFAEKDFANYDVKKEKPADLANIGGSDSLFCWVKNTLGGWLACDDGANEKADFIHLETINGRPTLSLIHVKGAKSRKNARRISVAAYEVVVGQATKNLLWLDKTDLAAGLAESARSANYWWHNGETTQKDAFVAAIEALGDNHVRRVVVVQPHVTAKAHHEGRKATRGAKRRRLDQLNALLASAWRSCNGLGVEFVVIWADSPAAPVEAAVPGD
jgi:hypothetical protein